MSYSEDDFKPFKAHERDLAQEYKSDLIKIKAGLLLASEEDTAMCIRIALGKGMFFDYWVENNKCIVDALLAEKNVIEKLLKEVKREITN